jgi:zinc resistance-associated protein
MKRTTSIAILAIFGIIALSSMTFAGPMRGMGMRGDCTGTQNPAIQQLPQEKQDLLKSILDEHRKDTAGLRSSMWEKRTLLEALSANSNTKPEEIKALVREMSDLRAQMQTKRDALEARVSKEVGIELPMGFGNHDRRGMGGHGRGGFGQHGMGQGMGSGMGAGMNPDLDDAPDAPDA